MSANSPFGPGYDEQPEDGARTGQWRPRAGGQQGDPQGRRPGPQGEPQRGQGRGYGQQPQGGQRPMPQAGRPSPQAGGAPRAGGPSAGGPSAGRPQPGPYQSPQHQSPQPGGYESRQPSGPVTGSTPRTDPGRGREYRPSPDSEGTREHQVEPFEEAAFADEGGQGEWGGGSDSTASGRLGYMPKERRRSDFQKVRSRARKSSPWPKILIGVVVLALVGGGVWWLLNRPASEGPGDEAGSGLTYSGSEEPCSLVDAGPLESYVDGTEPEAVATGEQKNSGWVQSCALTYGSPEQALALLEVETTVYESDARASVSYELSTREIGEMVSPWTLVEPAPEVGDQAAAVVRIPEEGGTSNYQLHLQDDNVYLVVRLSLADGAGLDQQGMTDLTSELAQSYLDNLRG